MTVCSDGGVLFCCPEKATLVVLRITCFLCICSETHQTIQSSVQCKGVALKLSGGHVTNITGCLSAFLSGPESEKRWGLAA